MKQASFHGGGQSHRCSYKSEEQRKKPRGTSLVYICANSLYTRERSCLRENVQGRKRLQDISTSKAEMERATVCFKCQSAEIGLGKSETVILASSLSFSFELSQLLKEQFGQNALLSLS